MPTVCVLTTQIILVVKATICEIAWRRQLETFHIGSFLQIIYTYRLLEIKTFGLGSRIGDVFSKIRSVVRMYATIQCPLVYFLLAAKNPLCILKTPWPRALQELQELQDFRTIIYP